MLESLCPPLTFNAQAVGDLPRQIGAQGTELYGVRHCGVVHLWTGASQGGVWATHRQQDYCHNRIIVTTGLLHGTPGDRGEPGCSLGNTPTTGLLPQQDYCHNMIIAWYTRGPGRAMVESGQHTNNRIIATTGLLHSKPGDLGEPVWSLGNTPTGLLPPPDYCMVHQGTWASQGGVWATHQQQDYCHDRIIATTGDRGEPGCSVGNIPTAGLLPRQDYCHNRGPGRARV